MSFKKILGSWFFLFLPLYSIVAQDVEPHSFPPVQNFSAKTYDSLIQNWDITQDSRGIIYIANVGEVLEYDGVRWQAIQIKNGRALSVNRGYNTKVYVGGIGSFGYLEKPPADTSITLKYHSLVPNIPDSSYNVSNVWNILIQENSIYFDEGKALFRLKDDKIKTINPPEKFRRTFKVANDILASDVEGGLYYVQDTSFVAVPNGDQFIDRDVNAILPYEDDQWLVADRTVGLSVFNGRDLIPLQSEADDFLVENKVYTGIKLPDETYLFGTLNKGIVQVDKNGKLLRKINSDNGLQSDQVHSLFLDQANNVWAALGNGLSVIEPMSPISYLDARSGLPGTVVDIKVQGDYLYASTTEGFFRLNIHQNGIGERLKFETLLDISVRCEKIDAYNNQLLVDCGNKVYYVTEGSAIELFEENDIRIVSGLKNRNNYYVLSRNSFLILNSNHKPVFLNRDFGYEVISSIEEDDGDLWIGTVSSGVFRIESEFFETLNDFDSYLHHYAVPHEQDDQALRTFNISGEAVIGSSAGLYRYEVAGDSLIRDHRFGEEMADPERQVFLMEENAEGNIYVRSNREHQVLLKEKEGYRFAEGALKRIDANQVNRIYAHKSGLVWMATGEGIIQYDPSKDPYLQGNPPEPFKTHVRGVFVRGDSLINADLKNKGYELEYEDNELRFQYAAAQYKAPAQTRYQVRLEGFEEDWSDWTSEVQKDYTNIPEGAYTFHVRARDVYGTVSKADTFSFAVLPPWYRTWWAYALYVLLIGGILYGIHRIRINRILREQRIRNRIASDLHDEVSATLSSITYFAQAIRQVPEQEKADRFVGLISESAGEAKEKITDIIWSIDPEKDDWVDLLSKCRRFASDLLESKGIDYELDIDTDINRSLDLELRQHLWLIFKEMVINAARHSEATYVDIRFGMEGGTLALIVADNGIGMNDIEEYKDGHGVKNIHQRAEKVGAEIELQSNASSGTRWEMTLDL